VSLPKAIWACLLLVLSRGVFAGEKTECSLLPDHDNEIDSGKLLLRAEFLKQWELCWQELRGSHNSTEFRIIARSARTTPKIVDGPDSLLALLPSSPLQMSDEAALELALMLDATTNLERALSWGGHISGLSSRRREPNLTPGCTVLSKWEDAGAESIDANSRSLLQPVPPLILRTTSEIKVSFVCEYADFGNAMWRTSVVINSKPQATVKKDRIGLLVKNRQFEPDSGGYQIK